MLCYYGVGMAVAGFDSPQRTAGHLSKDWPLACKIFPLWCHNDLRRGPDHDANVSFGIDPQPKLALRHRLLLTAQGAMGA